LTAANACAYCQRVAKLTREHIWPASIVRQVSGRFRYNANRTKLLWSDLVINDVCQSCNNGPLSELDTYGTQLFETYFARYITEQGSVCFEYDFETLARWLLKLSFNAARSVGSDAERLSRYAPALIDKAVDLPQDFSIALDLVLPSDIPGVGREILPASNRLCRIEFTNGVGDWCTVRLVAINSYYFWILIQDKPDAEVDMHHAQAVLSKIRGTYLEPSATRVTLMPSGATTVEIHKDAVPEMRAKASKTAALQYRKGFRR